MTIAWKDRTRAMWRAWWIALAAATWGLASPAWAASAGELCGKGAGWSRSCDAGLHCEVRWSLGPFRLGVCSEDAEVCGGLLGIACKPDAYCDYPPDALCGAADQTGTCQPRPQQCTEEYRPVCGCDGRTYGNACAAHAAGSSVAAQGVCGACTVDEDCLHGWCDRGVSCAGLNCPPPPPNRCTVCGDGSELRCRRALLPCPDGQVREIVGGCYGACVDRYSCEPSSCEYEGKSYAVGESFLASDGCNSCSCQDDGRVFCTLILCACDYEAPEIDWASRSVEQCQLLDFICPAGSSQFSNRCGCGCSALPQG